MRMSRKGAVTAMALLGCLGLPAMARAGSDTGCFDAYEQTQRLRNSNKLLEARDKALICARAECPAALRKDCTQWSGEITRMLATVFFNATDEQGKELAATSVFVDDRKVADSIDGRSVMLDPGAHKVRFESGSRTFETIIQLAAGETNRRIEGVLPAPAPTAAPLPTAPSTPAAPPSVQRHGIPTASYILGGVAGVGLISFISFAAAGRVEQGCSPDCTSHQISTMRAEYAVADVSWITGLVALGAGVVYWLARPSAPAADAQPAATGMLRFGASPQRGGASFGLSGRF